MGERRRDVIMHETRKLVAGACCALGGLAGVWIAIWSAPVSERQGALGADLAKLAQPLLIHLGLGLAAGTALGLAILLTALKPRGARASQSQRTS
jgi:hypothetical protein